MKTLIGIGLAALLSASAPNAQEQQMMVHINCDTVAVERNEIHNALNDPNFLQHVESLTTKRSEGSFSAAESEELMQLRVLPLNLQVRDAILEHGEFLCMEQSTI